MNEEENDAFGGIHPPAQLPSIKYIDVPDEEYKLIQSAFITSSYAEYYKAVRELCIIRSKIIQNDCYLCNIRPEKPSDTAT
jgi:hypothetical protein